MKNCRSIEKKITAYLHGELGDRELQAMQTHLESCGACRAALETERTTLELLGATLEAAPAPEQLSPWKKPVIRPRSLLAKIFFSVQLRAVLASSAIHITLFLLSGMLVIFSVVKKEEMRFEPPRAIERPKMKLRKPSVKLKKSSKPKSSQRIVTKVNSSSMPDVQLPEMAGIGSGLAGESSYGLDAAPDFETVTVYGGSSFEVNGQAAADAVKVAGKPTDIPIPKPSDSLYFSYGEGAVEPEPAPISQSTKQVGRERYYRAVAAVEKGAPAVLAGRGAGLDDDNADIVILPELEEVTMFGSGPAVADEEDAVDALGVDYYGFMEEKEERSAGDGESAKKDVDKIGGVSSDSVSALLFGVAEAEQPIVGSVLRQDTALQEPGSRNPEKPDSSPVVLDGDMALAEGLDESKDEGDRSEWLMRKVEPAVFNPYILASENAFSTFSIDVDTASYGLARQRLLSGGLPEPEQVRTEEFINSFDYDYRPPSGKQTFSVHSEMAPSPFRMGMDALKIGIKGRRIGRDDHRGAVLTLVVDTSGSMSTPERLGLVKESLALLIDQLNPADSVAIVQFGNEARLVLEHTPVSEKPVLLDAINALQPGGPTQFDTGLALGYQLAESGFRAGDSNRIMILSDGVANLGELDPEAILQQVAEQRKQGIYLSVLGFGAGTYDDDMLERLANKGDGMYAYIDTLDQARHLLVDQLAATLHVIASDVKIQVEFNPERVLRYRQLGYENRQLTKEQFRDDTVDAGEVGSGQSVTALYDVELNSEGPADEPIATVYVRYRRADNGAIEEISSRVTDVVRVQRFEDADARFQLSVCTAEFAERLRRSPYAEGTEIGEIAGRLQPVTLELALDGQVQELRQLISIAESLEK